MSKIGVPPATHRWWPIFQREAVIRLGTREMETGTWLKHARRKPLHYRPLEDYLAEEEPLKRGMEAKLKEFVGKGAEVYVKA